MPTRPLSHEARQRQAKAQQPAAQAQRQAASQAYAQRRTAVHGADPRSTGRWRRLRTMVLNSAPLCADIYGVHAGRPEPATEVDHIIGVWEAPHTVFDAANLQPLCSACHSRKSGYERRIKKD